MSQKNSLFVSDKELELFLDEKITNKLQNFIDSTSVITGLSGYKINIESQPRSNYHNIVFIKENSENSYCISFQNVSSKTICYCLRNWTPVSMVDFKKYIQEEI